MVGAAVGFSGRLRLTPKAKTTRGAAWHQVPLPAHPTTGLEFIFKFQITDPGADGFAFVVQSQGDNALGESGGGLGYQNIRNSIALEFDTYLNGDLEDPNANHISLHTCYKEPNSTSHSFSLACNPNVTHLTDQAVHTVRVTYLTPHLVVWLDGSVVLRAEVDIVKDVLSISGTTAPPPTPSPSSPPPPPPPPPQRCWAGFTAATGGLSQVHDILEWSCCHVSP
eukprot:TRINITY_DN2122_c0_g1_i1.p1 TRINITY_DN2122_c0_g1~~TRINITY_DN2122_c0_g1_i1.p1  ORF type:complete len:250 (-),score=81.75 TRINITY_DN2122_c0_g1_i1:225-896(-)